MNVTAHTIGWVLIVAFVALAGIALAAVLSGGI